MIKIASFILPICFLVTRANAQIGIGTTSPDPSAALHISDTTRGILIPRMTAANRGAISNPAEGLMVYQTDAQKGYWYFNGSDWEPVAGSAGGGKYLIILSGSITDAEAAAKIARESGPNTQAIRIVRCTNLTSLDLSHLSEINEIYISDNPLLQSVDLSGTQSINDGIQILKCPALATINLSGVKTISTSRTDFPLKFSETGIQNVSMPLLENIHGGIFFEKNAALLTVDLPLLESTGGIEIEHNPMLLNISMPNLVESGWMEILVNENLNNINFSSLERMTFLAINYGSFSTLSLPALLNGIVSVSSIQTLTALSLPLFKFGSFDLRTCHGLVSISLPSVDSLYRLSVSQNNSLATLTLPQLTVFSSSPAPASVQIYENPNLSTLNLSSLQSINSSNFSIYSNGLSSLDLSSLTSIVNVSFMDLSGNRFPTATVNSLLNKLAAVNPVLQNCRVELQQIPSAPPTGQGLVDKAFLISNSNNVITD